MNQHRDRLLNDEDRADLPLSRGLRRTDRAGRGLRTICLKLVCVLAVAAPRMSVAEEHVTTVPAREKIAAEMKRAAVWQLARPVGEGVARFHAEGGPTGWIQGAFYAGLMAAADATGDTSYPDAMRRIGEANGWKLGPKLYDADDHCVGQAYAELYLRERRPETIAALRDTFDRIVAHPKDDNLDYDKVRNPDHRDRWSWCDSLFMAPPAWVRLYAATQNPTYLDFAVRNWWVTSDFLYDPAEHLFFRDNSYFQKREPNGQKVFWARGNGWVLAGLARVLQYLPNDHPARPRMVRQFQDMAARIAELQQPDGFWRASLLDPNHYPAKEASGTGFFCYALAWGINARLLEREKFAPTVLRAWHALESCLTDDDRVVHVQPVGGGPKAGFPEDSTAPYGVGAFLLAGSEVGKLDSR